MINLEFHKGHHCPYKTITCQEGYCSECMIYRERPSTTKQSPHKRSISEIDKYINKVQKTAVR